MLLPSALPCDYHNNTVVQPKPQRPQRPTLPSFTRYQSQRSNSPAANLLASCRALQNILGERLSASPSPAPDLTPSSIQSNSPFGAPIPPHTRLPAPRGQNKRGRDTFEDDPECPPHSHCHSQYPYPYQFHAAQPSTTSHEPFQTPKRQRLIPHAIPGLAASAFEALASTSHTEDSEMDLTMPPNDLTLHSQCLDGDDAMDTSWSDTQDRRLVETVLSKLGLSRREWNDCAQQLGSSGDSLDRRWDLLVGGRDVGLRRGVGRMERGDLDISSW